MAVQPGLGRAASRRIAVVMQSVQGQWWANLRWRRRAVVMIWAAAEKQPRRLRLRLFSCTGGADAVFGACPLAVA